MVTCSQLVKSGSTWPVPPLVKVVSARFLHLTFDIFFLWLIRIVWGGILRLHQYCVSSSNVHPPALAFVDYSCLNQLPLWWLPLRGSHFHIKDLWILISFSRLSSILKDSWHGFIICVSTFILCSTRCSHFNLHLFCSSCCISHFSKKPWLFLVEVVFENH